MTKEAKKDTKGPGLFTRDDLINGLIEGESDIGGKLKDKIRRNHTGGTIKLKNGWEFNTESLLEEPVKIEKDGDVDKEETTSAQNHYYRYSFCQTIQEEKRLQLAEKLKGSEAEIDDVYGQLRDNKKCLLGEIDKELKPLQMKLEEAEAKIKDHTTR